jgi:hypothetical protein
MVVNVGLEIGDGDMDGVREIVAEADLPFIGGSGQRKQQ